MTSGEWDLRALKALEEEEQKEFLALSQKSLFEPPSPPAQAKLQQQQQQQINAQHLIHSALTERERTQIQQQATTCNTANATGNYMQLQAQQLLKLPTINEHHHHHHQHQQYLIKNKTKGAADSSGGGGGSGRLKFTKVLSLSAHSLTNRFGVSGGSALDGFGGGGLKKLKKSSGSNSPNHYGSPLYTPPPTRRCNTLHHSQPQARKAFKTLQQLEKQKQERKQELLSKNRTLQRIAGTNKTYWKYGINSTANSITLQHQQKLKQRKSLSLELESNTSDELGSEETQPIDTVQRIKEEHELSKELENVNLISSGNNNIDDYNVDDDGDDDDGDGNTDIGSCSVPLASDSVEMMSLMLTAASTAVKTQTPLPPSTAAVAALQQPPDIAATSGTVVDFNCFPKYFTLNHHNLNAASSVFNNDEGEETVAYEAFHKMFSRRKSFAGEKMLRAQTLQRNSSLQYDNATATQQHQAVNKQHRNVNNRSLVKSSSVEDPLNSYFDFNINSTTIITNPLTANNNTKNNIKSNLSNKTRESIKRKLINSPANFLAMPYTTTATTNAEQKLQQQNKTTICNPLCSIQLQQHILQNPAYHHVQQQALQLQQHSQHHLHQHHHLQDLLVNGNNDLNMTTTTTATTSSLIIDDELEEHIKQCSCSCNHMGYGNSMDYQTYDEKTAEIEGVKLLQTLTRKIGLRAV